MVDLALGDWDSALVSQARPLAALLLKGSKQKPVA